MFYYFLDKCQSYDTFALVQEKRKLKVLSCDIKV